MKKLAVILSLISCYSFAEEAAGFQNNSGGWTVITTRDQYCGSKDMNDGYAFGINSYARFCWTRRSSSILSVFETGETGVWHIDSFTLLPVEPEYNGNKL